MADGSIRINTRLNNKEIVKDLNDFSNMAKRTANNIKRAFTGKNTMDNLNQEIKETKNYIKEAEKEVDRYQKRIDNIDGEKSIKEVQRMIDKSNNEIEKGKKKVSEYQQKLDAIDTRKSIILEQVVKDNQIGFNESDSSIDKRVEADLAKNKEYQKLLSQETEIVSKMDQYSKSIQTAKQKVKQLSTTLMGVKQNTSNMLSSEMNRSSENIDKANKKLDYLQSKLKDVKSKTHSANKATQNLGTNITKTAETGIKKFAKMGLAIFGIRSAYTLVRRAANEYLQSNEQLSSQMKGIWNTLAQAIGPVVEKIIGGVVVLIGYINSLVKALTGIDLVARANANALNKQAKATGNAAKASRQLASFDEMNKLSNSDTSSSESTAITPVLDVPSVDVSPLTSKIEKLIKPIKEAWNVFGSDILQNWQDSFNSILGIANSIITLLEYIVESIDWLLLLEIIDSISEAFSGLLDRIDIGFENIVKHLTETDYSGAGKALSDTFINAMDYIREFIASIDWYQLGYDVALWVADGIQKIIVFILGIDWFGVLASAGMRAIEGIASALSLLSGIISAAFETAWQIIESLFNDENTYDFFVQVVDSIKRAFLKIADWFGETFSKAWENVKKAFSSGGKVFDGIKDGILNGLKSVINSLISGINKVIATPFNGLNSALRSIRSFEILGLKPFSFISTVSVPQIPKLAKGGIVNNPGDGVYMGNYIAGEKGAEAVVPLEDSDFIKSFAKEIASQLKDLSQPVTIVLQVGDKEFYKWFINLKRKYEFVTNGG